MDNRERLGAILNHQSPDRIPWIPRMLLWYNARKLAGTLPPKWQDLSLREIEHELRVGTPARDGRIFTEEYDGVDLVERTEGGKQILEYHTPVGMVRRVTAYAEELDRDGLPGRMEEYPLKKAEDYAVWEWIVQHTRWVPKYEDYVAYDAEIGTDGLPMVSVGDVPLHHWMLDLAGYDDAFFHLVDYTREVESLLQVMWEVERERKWPVIAESPAKLVLHGVHLSSQFTPPNLFDKYALPYYDELMPLLHGNGISVAMHADNDTSLIMDQIERAGWDMLECFVTAPMVPLTLERARKVWGNRIILWGCIPSLLLSPSVSEDDFRTYIKEMFRTLAPGDAVILGLADNVMPNSPIERVAWISDYVEEHGDYPLEG